MGWGQAREERAEVGQRTGWRQGRAGDGAECPITPNNRISHFTKIIWFQLE